MGRTPQVLRRQKLQIGCSFWFTLLLLVLFLLTWWGMCGKVAGIHTFQTFVSTLALNRESLKRFLLHFAETTDVLGNFSLDPLEARDRQLKFQGVRFEVSALLEAASMRFTSTKPSA